VDTIETEMKTELEDVLEDVGRAQESLEKIDRNQLIALRTMSNPPHVVQMIFEAVCILFGLPKSDWNTGKALLQDISKFIQSFVNFDFLNLPRERLMKLKKVISKPEFEVVEIIKKVSYAGEIAQFFKALSLYFEAVQKLSPKKDQMLQISEELRFANLSLESRQALGQQMQNELESLKRHAALMAQHQTALEETINKT